MMHTNLSNHVDDLVSLVASLLKLREDGMCFAVSASEDSRQLHHGAKGGTASRDSNACHNVHCRRCQRVASFMVQNICISWNVHHRRLRIELVSGAKVQEEYRQSK